ncbi:hypothetical protein C8F01DRAFT_676753 [Mycena amicta]|nr:hypothetical protein C8F01DRAFT_676753 [Mycena amicta]
MSDDEPRLPLELEHKIFLSTAVLHPATIPTLLLVAHRVLTWFEPLLYRPLHIGKERLHAAQLATALSKPSTFLARAVQSVVLHAHEGRYDVDAVRTVLSLCTGVNGLAVFGVGYQDPELLPLLSTLHLQRLSGYVSDLVDISQESSLGEIAAHPMLHNLTHLDLLHDLEFHTASVIVGVLADLPFLTHFAVSLAHWQGGRLDNISPWLVLILNNCRRLQILVVTYYHGSMHGNLATRQWQAAARNIPKSLHDPRFVLCPFRHWFEGVLDEPNYWTIAEAFVACKQRQEVDANDFWAAWQA